VTVNTISNVFSKLENPIKLAISYYYDPKVRARVEGSIVTVGQVGWQVAQSFTLQYRRTGLVGGEIDRVLCKVGSKDFDPERS